LAAQLLKQNAARLESVRLPLSQSQKAATQEARFTSYCRLLPPREIVKSSLKARQSSEGLRFIPFGVVPSHLYARYGA